MTPPSLGTLERVDLRKAWANEAIDFTPWLASEEGLKLLGATLGFDLQLEKVEKDVGSFSADILAKRTDTGDDHWVLIENQLAQTDHRHLGQLLTYAAGLDAATIIWIASEIRDEHRAALDWLNEITTEAFGFYGLEIELWRIGDSASAPKLNIVCRPNDWQRAAKERATNRNTLSSDLKQMQLDYWTALHDLLRKGPSLVRPQKAHPQHWATYTLGRSNAQLSASINSMADELVVSCDVKTPLGDKSAFHQLLAQKDQIEQVIGQRLEWREMPNRKTSRIVLSHENVDPEKREDWPNQHAWFAKTLDLFVQAFRPRVEKLIGSMPAPALPDIDPGADPENNSPPE